MPLGRPDRTTLLRAGVWVLALAAAAGWLAVAASRAARQPLWYDECRGLVVTVRRSGFAQLLLRGAAYQGNPAPMDYLLVKTLDRARARLGYLGLPPHIYFRLVGLASTAAAGVSALAIGVAASRRSRSLGTVAAATALALSGLLAYFLDPQILDHAVLVRPYALWTGLWLVSALSFLGAGGVARAIRLVAPALLAVTAVASAFQLAALAAAVLTVEALGGTRFPTAARKVATSFSIPFALCLGYCAGVDQWGFAESSASWGQFLRFWCSHWWVAAVSAAAVALCLAERETVRLAVPPLAMLAVYLLGPAVLLATRAKALFFTERHYLYWWTAVPIACVTCAAALSAGGASGRRRARIALASLAVLACLAGTARALRRTIPAVAEGWSSGSAASAFPGDPDGLLAGLLAGELPSSFCFANEPSFSARVNVGLVAEWLPIRYPALPIGAKSVVVEARGDGAEVRAIRAGCDSMTRVTLGLRPPRP